MKTFKIVGLIACILLLGYHIFSLDYQDLRFKTNKFHYMQIVAMSLIAMTFLLGINKDRKNKE
ncbi:hypothetical protein [Flavobacterium sp. 25HG05S-40]|uniref:hypothetical protein n=1 Tax=Flavobacterium sp. 25HG05S-40 TaxID=3458682 RepID=UPI004043E6E9